MDSVSWREKDLQQHKICLNYQGQVNSETSCQTYVLSLDGNKVKERMELKENSWGQMHCSLLKLHLDKGLCDRRCSPSPTIQGHFTPLETFLSRKDYIAALGCFSMHPSESFETGCLSKEIVFSKNFLFIVWWMRVCMRNTASTYITIHIPLWSIVNLNSTTHLPSVTYSSAIYS